MTNKNIGILVAVLVVVALGGSAIYLYQQKTQGTVIFGIKDAAVSMGSISSVMVTVNKIEMHNQANGWVTVSNATNQYDLMALKQSGVTSLLAQTNVQAGTYDQIRLTINKVMVTDNGVQYEAKLPSGQLKIIGTIVVDPSKTSTAVIDFMADKSLHVTGNGKFVFAPVVKIQTQSNTNATVDSDEKVHMTTGHVDTDSNEGMDVNGEMKENFELNENTKLDEVNNALKVTTDAENDNAVKVPAGTAVNAAVNNGYLDTATSVTLYAQNGIKTWVVSGLKNSVPTNVYIDAASGSVVNSNTQSGVKLGE